MEQTPFPTQIGLATVNGIILIITPTVLLHYLFQCWRQRNWIPIERERKGQNTRFDLLFAMFIILYSVFELTQRVLAILSNDKNYNQKTFLSLYRAFGGVLDISLLSLSMLLLYYSSTLVFKIRTVAALEQKESRYSVSMKGITLLSALVLSPLIIGFNVAEAVLIGKSNDFGMIILYLRSANAFLLIASTIFVLPIAIVYAYNVLRLDEQAVINVYEEDQDNMEELVKAKKHCFVYMLLATLLLVRLVIYVLHELMVILNFVGVLHFSKGVMVTDWLDICAHFACALFFVLTYFKPLSPGSLLADASLASKGLNHEDQKEQHAY
jgi:hypothetical protein